MTNENESLAKMWNAGHATAVTPTADVDAIQRAMRVGRKTNANMAHFIDKGVSMESSVLELRITDELKEQYRVRFLPKQVIRRELAKGINPFKL